MPMSIKQFLYEILQAINEDNNIALKETKRKEKNMHTSWKVELGKKIRALRESQELTQSEIARSCGVDSSYISKIERGVVTPRDLVHDLARYFGVPTNELYASKRTSLVAKYGRM